MPALKIATYNVNSLRLRLPQVLAWLNEHNPDALCVQETKVEDGLFPLAGLQTAGWQAAFTGQKSYNGVAIISRTPLTDVQAGFTTGFHAALTPADAPQARLISGTLATAGGSVRLMNVYVPNGEGFTSPKFVFKEQFYNALQAEVVAQTAQSPNLVIVGDFNIAAEARDVANPKTAAKQIGFSPTEQAWLQQFMAGAGVTDAFRLVDQTPNVYSWFDYRGYARNPNSGMRIDYTLVSPALAPKVHSVLHDIPVRALPQPSDHVPVVLTLNMD